MLKKRNKITINQWFYYSLKPLLRIWLQNKFNLEANIPDAVKNLKPPYLILPNHQGFWDPFMSGIYLKEQIFYIASDAIFRSPFFGLLMKFLGVIPKTKAQSDIDALKNIIEIKKRGRVIGIFPEGRRTWDGTTLPLIYSTSKLIRMLKIPVVVVVFKGGYFSQPRWGFHIQKGKVIMDYKILFKGDEVKSMNVSDIHSALVSALSFSEYEYQKEVSIEYKGKKSAEYLEQVLYVCPSCKTIGTMFSKGNAFSCRKCGYELEYNSLRKFISTKNDVVYNNIRDWNKWQQTYLSEYMENSKDDGKEILHDKNLNFYTGYKSKRLKYLTGGSLSLILNGTEYYLQIKDTKDNEIKSFNIINISGLNIQNKERLEFYHDGVLYTMKGKLKKFSAYKWLNALEYLVKDKKAKFQL